MVGLVGLVLINSFEKSITKLEVTLWSKSELKPPQNGFEDGSIADICGCQGLRFCG